MKNFVRKSQERPSCEGPHSRQVRHVAASGNNIRDCGGVAPQSCTTIQQGQGKRSCARRDSTPPILPNNFNSCQMAHEGPSLLRPFAADFSYQHDQSRAALGLRELRIRPVLLTVIPGVGGMRQRLTKETTRKNELNDLLQCAKATLVSIRTVCLNQNFAFPHLELDQNRFERKHEAIVKSTLWHGREKYELMLFLGKSSVEPPHSMN